MRNKCLFSVLLMVLAVPSLTTAQLYNSALLNPNYPLNNLTQTIVRNWDDKWVVTFNPNPKVLFTCTDYSAFFDSYSSTCFTSDGFFSDPLPSNYLVKDMRVMDDTLWFCGFMEKGTPENPEFYAFVGWFDLNQFIMGTFNPHFYDLSVASMLNKMVVYRDNGKCKAICIGYDTTPAPNSIIVEIDGVGTATSCNVFTVPTTYNEVFDDIHYTGTNVVVTGRAVFGMGATLTVRVWDDPSSIQLSSNWPDLCYYNCPPNELLSPTRSIHMENGDIAVAYDHFLGGTSFTYRLRIIETNSFPPTNSITQEFSIFKNSEANDMVYHKDKQKLVVLHPNQYYYHYLPQFTFLEPYNTSSYVVDITHFSGNYGFNSMDLYGEDNFISVSHNGTYLQYIPVLTNSGCPYKNSIQIYQLPNITISSYPLMPSFLPYSLSSSDLNWNTYYQQWICNCCYDY